MINRRQRRQSWHMQGRTPSTAATGTAVCEGSRAFPGLCSHLCGAGTCVGLAPQAGTPRSSAEAVPRAGSCSRLCWGSWPCWKSLCVPELLSLGLPSSLQHGPGVSGWNRHRGISADLYPGEEKARHSPAQLPSAQPGQSSLQGLFPAVS